MLRLNVYTITPTPEGWDATITQPRCRTTESIEGLYDFESALAWTHMHAARHNSRFTSC